MIKYFSTGKRNATFDSETQGICIPVNCEGKLVYGTLLWFKARFPKAAALIEQHGAAGRIVLGRPFILTRESGRVFIVCPIKQTVDENPSIAALDNCLGWIKAYAQAKGIESIAMPKMGCGNDERCIPWEAVQRLIRQHLGRLQRCQVTVYVAVGDLPQQGPQLPPPPRPVATPSEHEEFLKGLPIVLAQGNVLTATLP